MAYYVNRNVKLTWWERTYIPEIIRGMIITSRHFFKNLFGFVPFFLGKKRTGKSSPFITRKKRCSFRSPIGAVRFWL